MGVDCRSLIEFCRAFEQRKNMANILALTDRLPLQEAHNRFRHHHARTKKQISHPRSSSSSHCEQSPGAAMDIIVLLFVLGACGFLFTPYFKYACSGVVEVLPATLLFIRRVVYQAPLAYISGVLLMLAAVIGGLKVYQHKSRKCDNPHCKGLRKAVEFDIQLESEQCAKLSPPTAEEGPWNVGMELGEDHQELEAELRRMAPPNG
eukprot:c19704_g1_i1 orf=2-616(-)